MRLGIPGTGQALRDPVPLQACYRGAPQVSDAPVANARPSNRIEVTAGSRAGAAPPVCIFLPWADPRIGQGGRQGALGPETGAGAPDKGGRAEAGRSRPRRARLGSFRTTAPRRRTPGAAAAARPHPPAAAAAARGPATTRRAMPPASMPSVEPAAAAAPPPPAALRPASLLMPPPAAAALLLSWTQLQTQPLSQVPLLRPPAAAAWPARTSS